jgi:hypothetical protein
MDFSTRPAATPHSPSRLLAMALCAAALAGTLPGCAAQRQDGARAADAALPAPHPRLAPLNFMAGGWVTADAGPGKPWNEEHWMPARGASMGAIFRRVGADGRPRFFEVTAVTVETEDPAVSGPAGQGGEQVVLRLRHFHGKLDPRAGETEAMVLRLADAREGVATFTGVSNTRGVTGVTYTRQGADALRLTISYEPEADGTTPEDTIIDLRRVAPAAR